MSRKKPDIAKVRQEQLRQWLREALVTAGMRAADLSRAVEISADTLSKIMTGERDMQEHEVRQFAWATGQEPPEMEGYPMPVREQPRPLELDLRQAISTLASAGLMSTSPEYKHASLNEILKLVRGEQP